MCTTLAWALFNTTLIMMWLRPDLDHDVAASRCVPNGAGDARELYF
ncbi:hypothetical protein HaLaN_20263, partial [Haematococcus lacustris]